MTIHWFTQGAAAGSALLIGFIWYGILFKNTWMESVGLSIEKIKQGLHPAILYALVFVLAFVFTQGLYHHIINIHAKFGSTTEHPFWHGVSHGLTDSYLYGAIPVLIVNALFDQRNWKYILINVSYWIVTFGVMGGVIGYLG